MRDENSRHQITEEASSSFANNEEGKTALHDKLNAQHFLGSNIIEEIEKRKSARKTLMQQIKERVLAIKRRRNFLFLTSETQGEEASNL